MNRKQRRAAQKLNAASARRAPASASIDELFARGLDHHKRGELPAAAELYKKILTLVPDHAFACDRLAFLYLAQGSRAAASAQFSSLARMAPHTLEEFNKVVDTLKYLMPDLAAALAGPAAAFARSLAAPGLTAIAADPYFRLVLESTVVRDIALERWLTALRAEILRAALAGEPQASDLASDDVLALCGALAQQCFIDEYVFAVAPDELARVEQLKAAIADDLSAGASIDPLRLVALAMYAPLYTFTGAQALGERTWPASIMAVLTQQIHEPREEQQLRTAIGRLTGIDDGVSAKVRRQYEENPYPRWVRLAPPPKPLMVFDDYIRHQFPAAPFRPLGARERFDVLVAGCGTGRYALEIAQSYRGARVLAVDLSLASLAHAKRKTPPALSGTIEFAQADILALASVGRSFDVINAGGVLHHMDDPLAGWRELVKVIKPNGLMQVGLYSAYARREVIAARRMIAERGYGSTPDEIRRCRQDLLAGPDKFNFMPSRDFFTIGECRDLLFHVHERQLTVPEIKSFLAQNDLNFIGFEFSPPQAHQYHHGLFARAGWSPIDLDRWDAYEREHPDVFAGMYMFWIQKN